MDVRTWQEMYGNGALIGANHIQEAVVHLITRIAIGSCGADVGTTTATSTTTTASGALTAAAATRATATGTSTASALLVLPPSLALFSFTLLPFTKE